MVKLAGFGGRVRRAVLAALAFALVAAPAAFAQAEDFEGLTEAQIQAVYTGVLNQIGVWAGILIGVLAVIVGVMWVLNRLRGGSGVR